MMAHREDPERALVEQVRVATHAAGRPLLLAVSGGLDSMSLLDLLLRGAPERIAAVATFDHATGPAATQAVALVAQTCARHQLPFVTRRLDPPGRSGGSLEARWREARYAFLGTEADRLGAQVATAHTADDQIETVLMREMRGSGARGLAGLLAPGDVARPLLSVGRAELEEYARTRRLTWVEDTSNDSVRFFRNRVRHDLLPALRRARPELDAELLDIAARAADWRAELEVVLDHAVRPRMAGASTISVATTELAHYDRDSVAVLWGALAGRVGLALDRRGTHRCAAFTIEYPERGIIPLSGGWRVEARQGELVLRRAQPTRPESALLPTEGSLEWGAFRFSLAGSVTSPAGSWSAVLPAATCATVRQWRAGDRLAPAGGQGRRRVTRYLREAGVLGMDRVGWPVVEVDDEVVWIPGVRRSDAATAPSGGPARHYVCERTGG